MEVVTTEPPKRPRGRPRKDGKPAGSVKSSVKGRLYSSKKEADKVEEHPEHGQCTKCYSWISKANINEDGVCGTCVTNELAALMSNDEKIGFDETVKLETAPVIHLAPDTAPAPTQYIETTSTPVDMVGHPPHYTHAVLPNGTHIECIDTIEALNLPYHLGNVVKYIWRWDSKGGALENLKKARWYLDRYISKLENGR